MRRRAKERAARRDGRTRPCRLLLFPLTFLLAVCGCGKEPAPEGGAEGVRVIRYNCNIAEARDIVDIYAEVVNRSKRGTGPLELVARVIRPEEEVVEARTPMGRLRPRETRHVSMRFACKGRVALRHISVAVEPLQESQDTEEEAE